MAQYNNELVGPMRANGRPLSQEINQEMYQRVVDGDKVAVREMIEGNMSLVISKVDAYIGSFPFISHLRDDLISEGFVGLTIAVNRMATTEVPENPNPTGYMSHWISHSIGAVVDSESGVAGSVRTKQRHRKNGVQLPVQISEHEVIPAATDSVVDPMSMTDLRDMIDSCCETEQDRTIVRMREERYTDPEISKAIDSPLTTTYMRRRELYARFLEKSGMKGEV